VKRQRTRVVEEVGQEYLTKEVWQRGGRIGESTITSETTGTAFNLKKARATMRVQGKARGGQKRSHQKKRVGVGPEQ